jgi:transcriptional regulator with XRE-family HTH domain
VHPIAFHRHAKGWTQTELARLAGVSLTAVQAWERGSIPRPGRLAKLAELFGVDGRELLAAIQRRRGEESGEAA